MRKAAEAKAELKALGDTAKEMNTDQRLSTLDVVTARRKDIQAIKEERQALDILAEAAKRANIQTEYGGRTSMEQHLSDLSKELLYENLLNRAQWLNFTSPQQAYNWRNREYQQRLLMNKAEQAGYLSPDLYLNYLVRERNTWQALNDALKDRAKYYQDVTAAALSYDNALAGQHLSISQLGEAGAVSQAKALADAINNIPDTQNTVVTLDTTQPEAALTKLGLDLTYFMGRLMALSQERVVVSADFNDAAALAKMKLFQEQLMRGGEVINISEHVSSEGGPGISPPSSSDIAAWNALLTVQQKLQPTIAETYADWIKYAQSEDAAITKAETAAKDTEVLATSFQDVNKSAKDSINSLLASAAATKNAGDAMKYAYAAQIGQRIEAAKGSLQAKQSALSFLAMAAAATTASGASRYATVAQIALTQALGKQTPALAGVAGWWGNFNTKITLFAGAFGGGALVGAIGAVTLGLHLLIDAFIVIVPAIIAASAALGAFALAAEPASLDVIAHVQGIHTALDALGTGADQLGTDHIGPLTTKMGSLNATMKPMPVTIRSMQAAMAPTVVTLYGAAFSSLGNKMGLVQQIAKKTGTFIEDVAAKIQNALATPGAQRGLTDFINTATNDMKILISIGASVLKVFAEFIQAGQMTHVAELLFEGLAYVLSVLQKVIHALGPEFLAVGIGIFSVIHYGGALVTVLGNMVKWVLGLASNLPLVGDAVTKLNLAIAAAPQAFGLWVTAVTAVIAVVALLIYSWNQADQATKNYVNGLNTALANMTASQAFEQIPKDIDGINSHLEALKASSRNSIGVMAQGWSDLGKTLNTNFQGFAVYGRLWNNFLEILGHSNAIPATKLLLSQLTAEEKDWANEVQTAGQVSQKYGVSVSQAFALMDLAGVKASDSLAVMVTKVNDLVQGWINMGVAGYQAKTGLNQIGAAIDAVSLASEINNSQITTLTQDYTSFLQLVQGGQTNFETFATGLNTIATDAAAAGASMTGLNAASLTLRQAWEGNLTAGQALYNALVLQNAAAGNNAKSNEALSKSGRDIVNSLLAQGGATTESVQGAYALAQTMGYTGKATYDALLKWSGGNQTVTKTSQDLNTQVGILETGSANLQTDVTNLAAAINSNLNNAIAQGLIGMPKMVTAVSNVAASIHNLTMEKFGVQVFTPQAISAATALYNGLVALFGTTPSGLAQAQAEFDTVYAHFGVKQAEVQNLWKLVANPPKPKPVKMSVDTKAAESDLHHFAGLISNVAAPPPPAKWAGFWGAVAKFFHESLPPATYHFFAVDIPNWADTGYAKTYNNFLKPVGAFFSHDIPTQATIAGEKIAAIWKTVYTGFFNDVWHPLSDFWNKDLPGWVTNVGKDIGRWTMDIWHQFDIQVWQPMSRFWNQDIPNWLTHLAQLWLQHVKDLWHAFYANVWVPFLNFFTRDIPGWISDWGRDWLANVRQLWNDFYGNVWTPFEKFFTRDIPGWLAGFGRLFDSTARNLWSDITRDFIDPFVRFFSSTLPSTISAGFKDGVNLLIRNVIGTGSAPTTGIIGLINRVIGVIPGVPKIPGVPLLAAGGEAAAGGSSRAAMMGSVPGNGESDSQLARIMPGEWVVRKPARMALEAAYGPGVMHAINNADAHLHAGSMGTLASQGIPGFAAGGSWGWVPGYANGGAIAQDALKYRGAGYVWGGADNSVGDWDCSSFTSWVLGRDMGMALPSDSGSAFSGRWGGPGEPPGQHGPTTVQYRDWAGAGTIGSTPGIAQPGDLIVWPTHMGIATGSSSMVSALDPTNGTRETTILGGAPGGESFVVRRVSGVGAIGTTGFLSFVENLAGKISGFGLDLEKLLGLGGSELVKLAAQGAEAVFNWVWNHTAQPLLGTLAKSGGIPAELLLAGADTIKMGVDKLLSSWDSNQAKQAAQTGQYTGGGNAAQWLTAALKDDSEPLSWLPALEWLTNAESTNNPNAIDPILVNGEHAEGLLQTLPSTFQHFRNPALPNDIWNPIANAAAAINYIAFTYGSPLNIPGIFVHDAGYAGGGTAPAPVYQKDAAKIRPAWQNAYNKFQSLIGIHQPRGVKTGQWENWLADRLALKGAERMAQAAYTPVVANVTDPTALQAANWKNLQSALDYWHGLTRGNTPPKSVWPKGGKGGFRGVPSMEIAEKYYRGTWNNANSALSNLQAAVDATYGAWGGTYTDPFAVIAETLNPEWNKAFSADGEWTDIARPRKAKNNEWIPWRADAFAQWGARRDVSGALAPIVDNINNPSAISPHTWTNLITSLDLWHGLAMGNTPPRSMWKDQRGVKWPKPYKAGDIRPSAELGERYDKGGQQRAVSAISALQRDVNAAHSAWIKTYSPGGGRYSPGPGKPPAPVGPGETVNLQPYATTGGPSMPVFDIGVGGANYGFAAGGDLNSIATMFAPTAGPVAFGNPGTTNAALFKQLASATASPERPRTLSEAGAAHSRVGVQIGGITINNPTAEQPSQSITRSVNRLSFLAGRGPV